jgi:hypothetical protein
MLAIKPGSDRIVVVKSGFHRFAIKPGSDRVGVVKSDFHRFAIKPGYGRVVELCIRENKFGSKGVHFRQGLLKYRITVKPV